LSLLGVTPGIMTAFQTEQGQNDEVLINHP
jgi:hypothetical protein